MAIKLRAGRPDEAAVLSALALRSKAHWGYDEAFLDACRDELTLSAGDVVAARVTLAESDGVLAGFVALAGEPPEGDLSHLFVDPPLIGTGVGRRLFAAAVATARSDGFTSFTVDADPGAEDFYLRMGALRVGSSPSGSIPGRFLPRLRFNC
jgi:GNAT superfamily N-acetyltransferase